MGPAGGETAAKLQFPLPDIPNGRLEVHVRHGRVELGVTKANTVRIRAQAPARRWFAFRGRAVSAEAGADALRVVARQARLRIDAPAQLRMAVEVRRGQVTSWGARADLALRVDDGSVTCRELGARSVAAQAARVSLHFAEPPDEVTVDAGQAVVVLPPGSYDVAAPPEAEVTVEQEPGAAHRIAVKGADVRILAAASPLRLTADPADGG